MNQSLWSQFGYKEITTSLILFMQYLEHLTVFILPASEHVYETANIITVLLTGKIIHQKEAVCSAQLNMYKGCTERNAAILLCCHTTSEGDVGGMAVKVKPSHQYSIPFCCCVTDGSREAVWYNGLWHGSVYGAKVCHSIPPSRKNGTHWYPSTLAEYLWGPNNGCEHSEVVGGVFQQWTATLGHLHRCRFLWVQYSGSY